MNLMIKMFKNEDLWELYADDPVITAENEEHLQKKSRSVVEISAECWFKDKCR